MAEPDPFSALRQEYEALENLLDGVSDDAAARPSLCSGWTVADVVLHLALTEEAVVATITGEQQAIPSIAGAGTIDDLMEQWVAAERGAGWRSLVDRWKGAHQKALAGLEAADPQGLLAWAFAPLKPRTLATTRLAEHWIHANDIATPLAIEYPDTDRLWHVARLAHRTLPYAFARAGRQDVPSLRLELTGPPGQIWEFGPSDADCTIRGPAGEFCRVAARRLEGSEARLETTGDRVDEVLELVRTYA